MKRDEIIKEAEKYIQENPKLIFLFDGTIPDVQNQAARVLADFLIQQIGKEKPECICWLKDGDDYTEEIEPQQPDTEVEARKENEAIIKALVKFGYSEGHRPLVYVSQLLIEYEILQKEAEEFKSQKQQWDREREELVDHLKNKE